VDRSAHWEQVYRTKGPDQLSWFQAEARLSRQLIEQLVPERAARIIDIGAGASTLVDGLLASGYRNLTAVDLSPSALACTRQRLGSRADTVTWQVADVLAAAFPPGEFDLWHDRAVFHFLTEAPERAGYIAQARQAVRAGGFLLMATFAEDGPTRCSGLDVARYSPEALRAELGTGCSLVESHRELHTTPSGSRQAFTYGVFRIAAEGDAPRAP
jgi:SAM-dependent methyltransferase